MTRAGSTKDNEEKLVEIQSLVDELRKDAPLQPPPQAGKAPGGSNTVLEILGRAADDPVFLARLAENPYKALEVYDLSLEQMAALAAGDLSRIESWVGKLDSRLSTWVWCRLQLEKW